MTKISQRSLAGVVLAWPGVCSPNLGLLSQTRVWGGLVGGEGLKTKTPLHPLDTILTSLLSSLSTLSTASSIPAFVAQVAALLARDVGGAEAAERARGPGHVAPVGAG